MADKKKKNMEEAADGKKLAALEARIEGLNEQLEEAGRRKRRLPISRQTIFV